MAGILAGLLIGIVAGLRATAPAAVAWAARLGWPPVDGSWAGFMGAVIGTADGSLVGGLAAGGGFCGAVIGTLGGSALRSRIARNIGRDWPVALVEDAIAILGAFWIVFP